MANKFFMMAAVASVGCLAFAAPENWFNGGLGSESASVSGGAWQNATQTGVTAENYKYVLDEPENPLAFAATNAKLPEGTNLTFTTTANFKYSYDELPAVDDDAKAGVVVYTNRFYVLGKDGENPSNVWKKTEISLSSLDAEVPVSVVVTNGSNKTSVWATYTINNGTPFNTEVYVKSDAKSWNTVSYKGCGVVASLVGQTEQLGYPCPPGGGDPIPADRAEAWAEAQGISKAQLAAMLASSDKDSQGRTAAENCILGVAQNTALKATTVDDDASKFKLGVACNPISGRATFKLLKNSVAGEPQSSPDFAINIAESDGIYEIQAKVDKGEYFSVSQQIGVKGTAVTASKVSYIGAPWTDCPVTNLLKKTCCSNKDKLEVLDPSSCKYSTWEFNGTSGVWEYVPTTELPNEPVLTLRKGQAVKYTAAGDGTRYAIGDVSKVTATAITAGVDKWNLIAKPAGGDVDPANIPLDNAQARAVMLNDTGTAPARVFMKVKGKVYTGTAWNGPWTEVSSEKIAGGFFLKTKDAGSVNW